MAVSPSFSFTPQSDWLGYYASLPQTGASFVAVLLRLSGLEADETLIDYSDLAALLLGTCDEAIFANYARLPVTIVRAVRPATNDILYSISGGQLTWQKAGSSTGGANDTVAKFLVCYKPSSTATDAQIKPCWANAVRATTDGNDMTLRAPNGLSVIDSLQST